ncbi:GTPase [Desulfovibrio sulfodismutans]|uniref:GTPase n=1 Tax=Desulfolutivibrio sulfodismutans TaxID=63561 RepID=A0A7K3NRK1_9BACT|nr:dynamin family protein [Desulfolutivibrio sulfodismutans]NDY58820.1 GTPase [Desulfolutivibrio sulfodismutans]
MNRPPGAAASSALLHHRYQEKKAVLAGLLQRLAELSGRISWPDAAEARQTAASLLASLGEPFLFVVVGEVKTGKSSLVNALLGEDLCEVAPDPCTDRIRMILHGETASDVAVDPYLSHVRVPHEILREIAVVDTPGVDSIIDRHQEITERFIPKSDLVLFVFSAINPYSRSAWDFFSLVRQEWRRKVIFVLNQADLATAEQLRVNEASVRRLAEERGVADPVLFAVSATRAATDPEGSGIEAVRRYIRDMVTGGGHYAQKLLSLCDAASRLIERLSRALAARREDIARDAAQAADIKERMAQAQTAAGREAASLVARVTAVYARLSRDFADAFEAELTFGNMIGRSLRGMFRRGGGIDARVAELTANFAEKLTREVEDVTRQGAAHVSESILDRVRPLLDELEGRDRFGRRGAGASALSEERETVAREVRLRVEALLGAEGGFAGVSPTEFSGLDPKAAMGGVLMVVGTLFAVSVKSVVVDVTGGLVAASGMVLAGGTLLWKRPRIMRVFRKNLAEAGERLEAELSERLTARMEHLFAELFARFDPFFTGIAERERVAGELGRETDALAGDCDAFARDVGPSA